MKRSITKFSLALLLVVAPSLATAQAIVYVASNQTSGNILQTYYVDRTGNFRNFQEIPTGGVGTSGGLGNQGGIAVQKGSYPRFLVAVNAGSNDISLFKLYGRFGARATFASKTSARGVRPISADIHGRTVYIVNAGSAEVPSSVVGFRIDSGNKLEYIEGSERTLSQNVTSPAQIAFSPDGKLVAVTEKATNTVTTYMHDVETGLLSQPANFQSAGQTPFGFEWVNSRSLLVSEAFGGNDSRVSLYSAAQDGSITAVAPSVDAGDERAACWIATTPDNRFAYTTNTATNSISRFALSQQSLVLEEARDLETDAGPIDFAIDHSGRIGVVLNNSGSLQSFTIDRRTGELDLVDRVEGLPSGANGMILR